MAAAATCVLAIAAVVLATLGVAAYIEGQEKPTVPPTLTTQVQQGAIAQSMAGTFSTEPERQWDIPAQGVVTADGAAADAPVKEGELLASVNGRPIFALQGSVPVYRSIGVGSTGPDVAQWQAFLSRAGYSIADGAGSFGESTARAVFKFYRDRGFDPVDAAGSPLTSKQESAAGVPLTEYTFSPSFPVLPVGQCGTVAAVAEGLLCSLRTAAGCLVVEVPASDAAPLTAGMSVELSAPGGNARGKLGERIERSPEPTSEEPAEGEAPTAQKVAFTVEMAEGQALAATATGQARITLQESSPEALYVDAAAIRTEADTTWIQLADGSRVDVALGICDAGFCVIESSKLISGQDVALPTSFDTSPGQ